MTSDVMTIAKGLASGLPLSGVAARRELMARWIPPLIVTREQLSDALVAFRDALVEAVA